MDVVRTITPWIGTAAELLAVLNAKVSATITQRKDWFSKPRQVSDAMRRLAPGLRRTGIDVTFTREPHTRRRLIQTEKVGSDAVPASPAVFAPVSCGSGGTKGTNGAEASTTASPENTNVYRGGTEGDEGDEVKQPFSGESQEAIDGGVI